MEEQVSCDVPPVATPALAQQDVTMGDDWMDQSAAGCKDILPADQWREVSSLFTLIAPQGTMGSHSCLLETRGCVSELNLFIKSQKRNIL